MDTIFIMNLIKLPKKVVLPKPDQPDRLLRLCIVKSEYCWLLVCGEDLYKIYKVQVKDRLKTKMKMRLDV